MSGRHGTPDQVADCLKSLAVAGGGRFHHYTLTGEWFHHYTLAGGLAVSPVRMPRCHCSRCLSLQTWWAVTMPYSWRRNWTMPRPVSRRCCAHIFSNAALCVAMLLRAPPPSFWCHQALQLLQRFDELCGEQSKVGGRVAQTVHLHCLPPRMSAVSSRATAKGLQTMWLHHLSTPTICLHFSRGTPWPRQLGW